MQCGRSHRSPDLTRRTRTMLLSCGDALVDFLPVTSVDGRDAAVPVAGGSCLNIAVGMARLGAPAGFVGGISTDLFGRIIADHALGSRVDLRYATRSEHQTTLAFVRHVGASLSMRSMTRRRRPETGPIGRAPSPSTRSKRFMSDRPRLPTTRGQPMRWR